MSPLLAIMFPVLCQMLSALASTSTVRASMSSALSSISSALIAILSALSEMLSALSEMASALSSIASVLVAIAPVLLPTSELRSSNLTVKTFTSSSIFLLVLLDFYECIGNFQNILENVRIFVNAKPFDDFLDFFGGFSPVFRERGGINQIIKSHYS